MKRGQSGLNLLVGVNKPKGLSSHDVVNHVRRALGERRVGHAGTLDPLATGVLVVGVGQATRLLGMLTLDTKSYRSTIESGTQTATDDAEGEVVATAPVPDCVADETFAKNTLASILGWQDQLPPAYSAISVDGRRAYDRARAGQEVELEPRRVCIQRAALVSVEAGESVSWVVDFLVSKGTYVRSIARDLGPAVGTVAHLSALQRTCAGSVGLCACLSLETLEALGAEGVAGRCLDPATALQKPVRLLAREELDDVACGRMLEAGLVWDDGVMRAAKDGETLSLVYGKKLMGVWECRGTRLRCIVNFPDGISGVRT